MESAGAAKKWALVPAAALCISSGGLLVRQSQVGGLTLYSKYSVTLLSELVKLSIALVRWSWEPKLGGRQTPCTFLTPSEAGIYAVPGVLYVLVNNLRFPILERVNPGVLSVVWNLKVVGVAGLLACLLSRHITQRQWAGVAVLVLGSTLAEMSQWGLVQPLNPLPSLPPVDKSPGPHARLSVRRKRRGAEGS